MSTAKSRADFRDQTPPTPRSVAPRDPVPLVIRARRRPRRRPADTFPRGSPELTHPRPGAAATFRPCRGTRPPVTPTQACRKTRADGPGVAWPVRRSRTASEDPPATRSLADRGTSAVHGTTTAAAAAAAALAL